jgi:S-adenosylmethionine decarboxylase
MAAGRPAGAARIDAVRRQTGSKGVGNAMNALGRHVLAEVHGCDPEVLNDVAGVEEVMVQAALHAGAEVREVAFHKFSPQGVSGVVVISESHLAVHTWPEHGYAAVDVFTCGDSVNPWDACQYIVERFGATHFTASETLRGVMVGKAVERAAV